MAHVIRRTFFGSPREDAALAGRNEIFWRALLGHIEADRAIQPGATILDWGCHRGGLLCLAARQLRPQQVHGLEPLLEARRLAQAALDREGIKGSVLHPDEITSIGSETVDLIISHEVFYLLEDLSAVMNECRRILRHGGAAYVVLGCHTENPIWSSWKAELEGQGLVVFDHAPFDLLRAASDAGFSPAFRPLRDRGWVHYDPNGEGFSFPSASALLEHQFKHKLLFRFMSP